MAHAATISLGNDFSISNGNPNGQWVYQDNTTNLTLQIPLDNGNPLRPALATGYWGLGNNLNLDTPDFFKALVNGSSAGETNNDFLAGDIVGHSPNDGSTLFERWTAPSSGAVTNLSLSAWYAHSIVSRSDDVALYLNNNFLCGATLSPTVYYNRGNAFSCTSAGFAITAGDVISLGLTKTAGQAFGSLAGESLNFTFTPAEGGVPEPGTVVLTALGVCSVLLRRRRGAGR